MINEPTETNKIPYREYIAYALIIAGLLVASSILNEIIHIFNKFHSHEFLNSAAEKITNTVLYTNSKSGTVTLGKGGALAISFFFLLVLLGTGATISQNLIISGVKMLNPNVEHDIKQLKTKMKKMATEKNGNKY